MLGYHGLIEDRDDDRVVLKGTMFADWFRECNHVEVGAPTPAELSQPVLQTIDRRRVFVIHGRNMRVRNAMFEFLRALRLEPLEWSDIVEATGNPAPHIAEILEKGFSIAQAAVVLLTPDDEARLRDEFRSITDAPEEAVLTPQPRPNVLFEAGMAMAKFPKATVLVQVGHVRPFSDISGIHLVHIDDSYKTRRHLAKRLEMAGCALDQSDTLWHTAGEFSKWAK